MCRCSRAWQQPQSRRWHLRRSWCARGAECIQRIARVGHASRLAVPSVSCATRNACRHAGGMRVALHFKAAASACMHACKHAHGTPASCQLRAGLQCVGLLLAGEALGPGAAQAEWARRRVEGRAGGRAGERLSTLAMCAQVQHAGRRPAGRRPATTPGTGTHAQRKTWPTPCAWLRHRSALHAGPVWHPPLSSPRMAAAPPGVHGHHRSRPGAVIKPRQDQVVSHLAGNGAVPSGRAGAPCQEGAPEVSASTCRACTRRRHHPQQPRADARIMM